MILSNLNSFVLDDSSSAAGRKHCFSAFCAFFFYEILFQSTALDFSNQYLAPGGKGTFGSWGKGSSGGTSTKPVDSGRYLILLFYLFFFLISLIESIVYKLFMFESPGSEAGSRPATSTLNRFSALQQPSSSSAVDSDRRVPQR